MKRGYDRTHRVADLIQRTLAPMLLQDMTEERFHLVTITDVSVSKDLSFAKVYISVLIDDEKEIKEVVHLLNQSAKSFRYQLAHSVSLRMVPELKFVYDESTARGFRISNLIANAMKKTEK